MNIDVSGKGFTKKYLNTGVKGDVSKTNTMIILIIM
jgi:hypothetical protein